MTKRVWGRSNPGWVRWYEENKDHLTPCPECGGAGFFGEPRHYYSCGTCRGVGFFDERIPGKRADSPLPTLDEA